MVRLDGQDMELDAYIRFLFKDYSLYSKTISDVHNF